ncbi:uncharacterized protein LOC110117657 [Ceratitis capitata]|uniref:uncharacterized protein LOC110117657 n=1 Tax=Ceratitis capitata TaxID=7213 RepID=UPI000A0FB31B|nr:uncharacterized protein LOC110117657 [Ceratitis capitata]
MSLLRNVLLSFGTILSLQFVASKYISDYRSFDMVPVYLEEEESVYEEYRINDDSSKNKTAWDKTKLWVVISAALSVFFIIFPILVYLFCPNACCCGCKPVEIRRVNN